MEESSSKQPWLGVSTSRDIRIAHTYQWAVNFFSGMTLNLNNNWRFRVRAVRCN